MNFYLPASSRGRGRAGSMWKTNSFRIFVFIFTKQLNLNSAEVPRTRSTDVL